MLASSASAAADLKFRIDQGLQQIGIAQLDNNRVCGYGLADLDVEPLDEAVAACGNQPAFFRHQRAETTNVEKNRAALHRVDPDRGTFHTRRRRPQSRQSESDCRCGDERHHDKDRSPDFFSSRYSNTGYVHISPLDSDSAIGTLISERFVYSISMFTDLCQISYEKFPSRNSAYSAITNCF